MKFICIMGRSGSGKSTVEETLENLGFKRSISYTTRESQVRNGVQEEHGKQYLFVTKDKFMSLVEKGIIIEYEEYNNNLYGTPKPFGAKRYVAVVCLGGFKALKELYGEQVLGVYLKCSEDIVENRGKERDGNSNLVNSRKKEDEAILTAMEKEADIVINSNQHINNVIADILKELRERNV